jgi:outer membrane protein OmpA-like peptidoglycan-associated protein
VTLLVLFQTILNAQSKIPTVNTEKLLKQAQKKMHHRKYSDAIALLQEIVNADSTHAEAQYLLGEVHHKIRDYVTARNYFKTAYQLNKHVSPLAGYYYALMLKMNGQYDEAKKTFQEFLKNYRTADNYTSWAKVEIQGCDMALSPEVNNNDEVVEIRRLDEKINSRYSEMGPMFWDDTTMLFASLPRDTILLIGDKAGLDYHIKFFLADYKNDSFFNVQQIDDFRVPSASLANGCLSADKTKFYFTACNDQFGAFICQLYMSKFQYGKWNEPERIEAPLNDLRYNNAHPAIAAYKKGKQIMYFSSDRPGGKGGKDIWYSIIEPNGKFSQPVNAGDINTSRDEITPFYDNLNGTLYFSSDGHAGYGGLDVFRASGERNTWTEIVNLGMPVNSSVDDLYFSFDGKRNIGLLVSNRSEKNVAGSTCCDDIFFIKYLRPKKLALTGYVKDASLTGNTVLDNAYVTLLFVDSAGNQIVIKEKTTGQNEPFYFLLQPDKHYIVRAGREGYFNNFTAFNTIGRQAPDTIRVDIILEKIVEEKTYRLTNIYYHYNDYALTPESKATLDTLFEILQENPSLHIEISSHTDSRGSDAYNLSLSQKRAQSCVNYLIAKGISPGRLVAKGYGASRLLRDCSEDNTCGTTEKEDCECHRLNRRTEFRVLKLSASEKDTMTD